MTKDKRKLRRSTTGEVFTPDSLLDRMASLLSPDVWEDSKKTFLDNTCGNGNIIIYIIRKKLDNGSGYLDAISTVYGIDFMQDNIEECHERIKNLLRERDIIFDETEVDKILRHNIICHDALDWDYENWRPVRKIIKKPLF